MYRASRQFLSLGTRAGAAPSRLAAAAAVSRPSLLSAQRRTSPFSTKPEDPSKPPFSAIDPKHDAEVAQKPIRSPPPSQVSSTSTLSTGFSQPNTAAGTQVGNDVKAELHAIKDAFTLDSVPREANLIGLAGTLPYLATSVSTMFLSWSLNREWPQSGGLLNSLAVSHDSAQQYLAFLEPVQLGYGAVIISFLGAIHWGMEWNERQAPDPERTRMRYAIGVAAPAVAWPTLLMPLEFALTSQFAAFAGLYFVDARMAVRGWAPRWYAPYRFLLTAVVGAAIGVTLIGRAKISDDARKSATRASFLDKGLAEAAEEHDWDKEEAEAKTKREAEEEEKRKEEEEKKKAEDEAKAKKQGGKKKGDTKSSSEGGKSKDDSDTHKQAKNKSKEWAAEKSGQKGEQDVSESGGVRGQQPKTKTIKLGGESEEGSEGPTDAQKAEKADRKADKTPESKKKSSYNEDGGDESAPPPTKGEAKDDEKGGLLAGQNIGKGHAEVARNTKEGEKPPTKAKGKTVGDE